MSENSIKGIMDTAMDKIRAMVDADTIIGDPIVTGDITIIPVSKVSFGLATGGSDFPSKIAGQSLFGGGGGAGVSITPVAFLAISDGNVKLMSIYEQASSVDRAVALVPEIFEQIKSMFKSCKKEKKTESEIIATE